MAYDPNVLRRATEALEEQRRANQTNRARLRADTYRRQPRLEQLDRQLQGTMAQLMAAALRRGESTRDAVQAIRQDNLSIQAERKKLLTELNLSPDALEGTPLCPHCGDSGWKGVQMCSCLKKLYTQEQIAELSKLLDLGSQSFDTFRLDYYDREFWSDLNRSPREHMERVLTLCRNYAEHFGTVGRKNLFLTGNPGLGKTFLSACIARVVSERGYSVVYDTAANIFSRFETRKFARDAEEIRQAEADARRYLTCDLLILDDLGSEFTTPFIQAALYEVINTRLVEGKHTVISSNLDMNAIRQRYTPQVASRLEGEYQILPFVGQDIRLLKKQRG